MEKQAVVLGDGTDADVVAFADDELEAAVQVFHVRGGRVRGQRGWIVEKSGDPGDSGAGAVGRAVPDPVLRRPGGTRTAPPTNPPIRCPARCWCRVCRPTPTSWPAGCPGCVARGSRCGCRAAGDKRALAETVQRNAKEALQQHKLKRAGDFNARSAALQNIQDSLGLAEAPLRIECVDISHVQGTDVVGSLVVFEDGLPRKSDYRHFGDPGSRRRRALRRRRLHRRGDPPPVPAAPERPERSEYALPGRKIAAGSPTRPICTSSTAARRRSTRPAPCSTSSASPTSR